MNKKYVAVLIGVLVGYVAKDQIARLPLVNKIPTV